MLDSEPPCLTCWPPAMEDNKETIIVFWYAMNHKRYEQGKFIGVDMNYVVKIMEILEVKERRLCLDGVIKLVNFVLEEN
jgi:hypothetical protein